MTTRIEKILASARNTLSDPNGERWNNERLLSLLDEAQKYLVNHTGALKKIVNIIAIDGVYKYSLPDDIITYNRVEYDRKELVLKDIEKVPKVGLDKGIPEICVFDKLNRQNLMIYPTPKIDKNDTKDYYISVFYTYQPKDVDSVNSTLEISKTYDTAMRFYVVYQALLDNQDTLSMNIASEFKNLFAGELQRLSRDSSKDYISEGNYTKYFKGFER
jgi:hypothetical protein